MKCEVCNGEKLKLTRHGYVCEKCKHLQKPQRKQYTYPLGEEIEKYAKK